MHRKKEAKTRFEDPELQKSTYSTVFNTLRLLEVALTPKRAYFALINAKVLLPGARAMGQEVSDFASELHPRDVEQITQSIFPATEAGIIDPLSIEEFLSSDTEPKKMEFQEYCKRALRPPEELRERLSASKVPAKPQTKA